MEIRTLTGDDQINQYLMAAMGATIDRLQQEGTINEQQASEFLDKHLCLLISPKSGFCGWFTRLFGDREGPMIKVVQVETGIAYKPKEQKA